MMESQRSIQHKTHNTKKSTHVLSSSQSQKYREQVEGEIFRAERKRVYMRICPTLVRSLEHLLSAISKTARNSVTRI